MSNFCQLFQTFTTKKTPKIFLAFIFIFYFLLFFHQLFFHTCFSRISFFFILTFFLAPFSGGKFLAFFFLRSLEFSFTLLFILFSLTLSVQIFHLICFPFLKTVKKCWKLLKKQNFRATFADSRTWNIYFRG